MNFTKKTLLIIAPHADDEILGCFGLINKIKKQGGKVFVQLVTINSFQKKGVGFVNKKLWIEEFKQVCKFLKIDGYDIAYKDSIARLDTIPQVELIDLFDFESSVSIQKIKPDIVAIPTLFSHHQDHIATFDAAITALRTKTKKSGHNPEIILTYEEPTYSYWSKFKEFGNFSANFFMQLTETELKKKIKGVELYKTQIRKGQLDDNSITKLAAIRGFEIGTEYAEGYHIYRAISKI